MRSPSLAVDIVGGLVLEDLDGDKDLDLAESTRDCLELLVLFNKGNGDFEPGFALDLRGFSNLLLAGDLDGDQDLDLLDFQGE